MNISEIRKDFPQLKDGLIYFDTAATSLKPKSVIDAVRNCDENLCANVGRGLYRTSYFVTQEYEEAHQKVRRFFNTKAEVVFTKNCTEAINLVAQGIDWQKGDGVVTTYLEHNSNLLPWLKLRKQGIIVKVLPCQLDGTINLDELAEAIDTHTRLVAFTHASNVLGTIQPVEKITEIAKKKGAFVLIDGAQAAPHLKVDIDKIGCNFYAGSGHKMLGPSGTGFLIIDQDSLNSLQPLLLGGGTVLDVDVEHYVFVEGKERFEGGTPNISGGIGLGYAVDYLEKIGMEQVRKHEMELTGYFIEKLRKIEGVRIHGPGDVTKRTGVVAFAIKNLSSHRIAIMLDELGNVAIRSGLHCAFLLSKEILKENLGIARVSFYIYNNKTEIDRLVSILQEIKYA